MIQYTVLAQHLAIDTKRCHSYLRLNRRLNLHMQVRFPGTSSLLLQAQEIIPFNQKLLSNTRVDFIVISRLKLHILLDVKCSHRRLGDFESELTHGRYRTQDRFDMSATHELNHVKMQTMISPSKSLGIIA